MIKVFKQKHLKYSYEVYYSYLIRLDNLSYLLKLNSLQFANIIFRVEDFNRVFYKLIKEEEYRVACTLIRLQADNLRLLVAEYLYPNKVWEKIDKGVELGKIFYRSSSMSSEEFNKFINDRFDAVSSIYKQYSKVIHPSEEKQIGALKYNWMGEKKERVKVIVYDMVYLNQCILDILQSFIKEKESELEDIKSYRKQLRDLEKAVKVEVEEGKRKANLNK